MPVKPGTSHGVFSVVMLHFVVAQRLGGWELMYARDFFKNVPGVGDIMHLLNERVRAKVDLALEMRPGWRLIFALAYELSIESSGFTKMVAEER